MEVTSESRKSVTAPRGRPARAATAIGRARLRSSMALAARFVGALSLPAVGAVHPQLRGHLGGAATALLALGGIGLAGSAFAFLLVAGRTPVFGFQEPGYDPAASMASRVAEVVTVGLLSSFLIARFAGRGSAGRC